MNDIPDRLLTESLAFLEGRGSALAEAFLSDLGGNLRRREVSPHALPVLRCLHRVTEIAQPDAKALAKLLSDGRSRLHWGQTYSAKDFGTAFLDRYGWTELFGTRGPFASGAIAGGFLLLGPEMTYPDHHHVAEEIYVPLTPGTLWRRGAEGFVARAPGEVIHHPSGMPHAMRTGVEPLLALYLWRGGDLAQKSSIVAQTGVEAGADG